MNKPACQQSRNRAFLDPENSRDRSVHAAVKICEGCPLLSTCASSALQAGITLDEGYRAPASGVIQAGIVCRGDLSTALALAAVAGEPVPDYWTTNARKQIDDHCKNCNRPMVSWTRDGVPRGFVMHYARGYCSNCRQAYRASLANSSSKHERQGSLGGRGLRKVGGRKKHPDHNDAPCAKLPDAAQLALFDGPTLLSPEGPEEAGHG